MDNLLLLFTATVQLIASVAMFLIAIKAIKADHAESSYPEISRSQIRMAHYQKLTILSCIITFTSFLAYNLKGLGLDLFCGIFFVVVTAIDFCCFMHFRHRYRTLLAIKAVNENTEIR